MNKSKIYFGAIGFLLSVVALCAAKASKRTTKTSNGYTRGVSSCNFVRVYTSVTKNNAFDAGLTLKTYNKTVFTRGITNRCGAILHEAETD